MARDLRRRGEADQGAGAQGGGRSKAKEAAAAVEQAVGLGGPQLVEWWEEPKPLELHPVSHRTASEHRSKGTSAMLAELRAEVNMTSLKDHREQQGRRPTQTFGMETAVAFKSDARGLLLLTVHVMAATPQIVVVAHSGTSVEELGLTKGGVYFSKRTAWSGKDEERATAEYDHVVNLLGPCCGTHAAVVAVIDIDDWPNAPPPLPLSSQPPPPPPPPPPAGEPCPVCLEEGLPTQMLPCGHPLCATCVMGIHNAVLEQQLQNAGTADRPLDLDHPPPDATACPLCRVVFDVAQLPPPQGGDAAAAATAPSAPHDGGGGGGGVGAEEP